MAKDPETNDAEPVCYLTTTGRVTGLPRTVEIWFALLGSTIYIISGNGDRADWVKNARRDPNVSIRIQKSQLKARARFTLGDEESNAARRLLFDKYDPANWGDELTVAFDICG